MRSSLPSVSEIEQNLLFFQAHSLRTYMRTARSRPPEKPVWSSCTAQSKTAAWFLQMPLATLEVPSYKRAVLSQEDTSKRLELLGEKAKEEMPSCGGFSKGRSLPASMLYRCRWCCVCARARGCGALLRGVAWGVGRAAG